MFTLAIMTATLIITKAVSSDIWTSWWEDYRQSFEYLSSIDQVSSFEFVFFCWAARIGCCIIHYFKMRCHSIESIVRNRKFGWNTCQFTIKNTKLRADIINFKFTSSRIDVILLIEMRPRYSLFTSITLD